MVLSKLIWCGSAKVASCISLDNLLSLVFSTETFEKKSSIASEITLWTSHERFYPLWSIQHTFQPARYDDAWNEILKYFVNTPKIAVKCTCLAFKQGYILLRVIYEAKVIHAITSIFVLKFCWFLWKKRWFQQNFREHHATSINFS